MPSFLPGFEVFALAGALAALGPVVIHLMNRRRFRVVEWAAMDFLREAVQRNRRILRLRDLLLLILRTAVVLLFGLALARPFFSGSFTSQDPDAALHAVVLIDNSLSTNYQTLGRNVLDLAKVRAEEFIDELPEGSRITVVPVCGSPAGYTLDAYTNREDARAALKRIVAVDRGSGAAVAADLAREACRQVPELAKRVVLIGDQQKTNWTADAAAIWKDLPEVQVVDVGPQDVENSWVEEFRVQDSIADVETTTVFTAILRHLGPSVRENVSVALRIDGTEIDSKTVDLHPGQALTVSFPYRFDASPEPGQPLFSRAEVTLSPDRLPEDDARYLAVPVVASLPVVFVDQYGEDEDPESNKYGESHHLRRLLAPQTSRDLTTRHLVQIRHTTIELLNREMLQDARLVVLAGVADPEAAVGVLREYVLQGGQLVIAAGAGFNPLQWNDSAWLDGAGILPAPLAEQPVGKTPDDPTFDGSTLQLSLSSMTHEYFRLPEVTNAELADLYAEPFFFKAIEAQTGDEISAGVLQREQQRIAAELEQLALLEAHRREYSEREAQGQLTDAHRATRDADAQQASTLRPNWLLWDSQRNNQPPIPEPEDKQRIAKLASEIAQSERPHVLASFEQGVPFIVERRIGRGQVLLAATGAFSDWNTLPRTNAVLLFDRIFRSMLENTLPERNFSTSQAIVLPIPAAQRRGHFQLTRPDGSEETLTAEALGDNRFGLAVRDTYQRGAYRLAAYRDAAVSSDESIDTKLWDTVVALNGPANESELTPTTSDELAPRMAGVNYHWVGPGESIRLEGAQVYGRDLWWYLALAAGLLLLAEMLLLAWPQLRREEKT